MINPRADSSSVRLSVHRNTVFLWVALIFGNHGCLGITQCLGSPSSFLILELLWGKWCFQPLQVVGKPQFKVAQVKGSSLIAFSSPLKESIACSFFLVVKQKRILFRAWVLYYLINRSIYRFPREYVPWWLPSHVSVPPLPLHEQVSFICCWLFNNGCSGHRFTHVFKQLFIKVH